MRSMSQLPPLLLLQPSLFWLSHPPLPSPLLHLRMRPTSQFLPLLSVLLLQPLLLLEMMTLDSGLSEALASRTAVAFPRTTATDMR